MTTPALAWPRFGRVRRSPWFPGDKVTVLWSNALGAVGVIVGYLGASGTVTQSTQVRWIAVAVGAAAIAGVGNALWLASGVRSVRTRRQNSNARFAQFFDLQPAVPRMAVKTGGVTWPVAMPTMTHYHRAGCIMASGKAFDAMSADEHQQSGRRPCPICRP